MLTVKVHGLDEEANDQVMGAITWDGRRYVLTPEGSPLLARVLESAVPVRGRTVTREQPEDFLHSLHRLYHSAYLRVLPPEAPFTQDDHALDPLPRQPVAPHAGYHELYQLAVAANHYLDEFLCRLNFRVLGVDLGVEPVVRELQQPGPCIILADVMTPRVAEDRVAREYQGDWSRLVDMVRATVAVDSLKELHGLVEKLHELGVHHAAAPRDHLKNPTIAGYRDLIVFARMPSLVVAEIQLALKPMLIAKVEVHRQFGVMARIDRIAGDENRQEWAAAEQMEFSRAMSAAQGIYDRAWRACVGEESAPQPEPAPQPMQFRRKKKYGIPRLKKAVDALAKQQASMGALLEKLTERVAAPPKEVDRPELGVMLKMLEKFGEAAGKQQSPPVVNVTVPPQEHVKTKKIIHRDSEGRISHVEEVSVQARKG